MTEREQQIRTAWDSFCRQWELTEAEKTAILGLPIESVPRTFMREWRYRQAGIRYVTQADGTIVGEWFNEEVP